eukprot:TRINITY_DN10507_c0_g1_i3.p1 TRINITY_DN10507_c0_g1~~TRINITY_DN10507_c0_g1_i3.p1  ORF type:complete len:1345 (+),score=321.64 TRINITY_DN10507_c0_g1_i3:385-4419(+)
MKVFEVLDLAGTRGDNVFNITLNIDTKGDSASAGSLRVYLRDSGHREAHAGYQVDSLFDSEWHFVEVHVVSASRRDIALYIDGAYVLPVHEAVDYPDEYGPTGFATWVPVAFVGATTICKGGDPIYHLPCLNTFKGYLADLAIWEYDSDGIKSLTARVPLADPKGIRDMVSGSKGESIRAAWVVGNFPTTYLRFEGDSFVNVGTLGAFGGQLSFFSMELWMRSSVVDREMCLVKVTDNTKQAVGMTLHSDGKVYSKNKLVVELCDSTGKVMVGTIDVELCDGVWHHVYWAFHYGDVMVVLDGTPAEISISSDLPTSFHHFSTFIPIGAHNNNGYVRRHFDGYISDFEICTAKKPFSRWKLNDGPGSLVIEDSVGKSSGTFVHCNDRVKKHNYWAPWHPIEEHGFISSEIEDLIKSLEWKQVEMHDNNVVRGACLAVDTTTDGSELLMDIVHQREVTELAVLPDDVWTVMTGYSDVKEFFETTMQYLTHRQPAAGHLVWLLGVGDAVFCLCMIAGSAVRPGAYFNPATLGWQGPISSFGKGHKQTLYRNQSIRAFETAFLKMGSRPELWLSENCPTSLIMQVLVPFIKEGGANTYFLHTCCKGPQGTLPYSDVGYAFAVLGGLHLTNINNAAVVIQRNVRRYLALLVAKRERAVLKASSTKYRVPHRASVSGPASSLPPLPFNESPTKAHAAARSKRMHALLIASYLQLDSRIEPALDVTHHLYDLQATLTRVGYEVVMIHSKSADFKLRPTRDIVKAKVKQFLEADAAYSLIWVAGRGSSSRGMYNPPMQSSFRRWMESDEREAREHIDEQHMLTLRTIVAQYPYPKHADPAPVPIPRTKASIAERYKYAYTRWLGNSNKMTLGDESPPASRTPRVSEMANAAARLTFEKFETEFRYRVSDIESSARSRLFTMLDEDLEWAKRYPTCHARHVMLDDSPLACNEASALTVSQMRDMVLGSKGAASKMLVVDCVGWRGEAGHFFIGSAAGTFSGDYCINPGHETPSYLLVSLWLARALSGIPGTMRSEYVTVSRVSEYIISRLAKYPRVQLQSDSAVNPSCPTIRMTTSIAKTRQELHAEKEQAALVGTETKKQFWSFVSCNEDIDIFDPGLHTNIDAYLKTTSGVRGTELLKIIPLPWVDVEVALPMSRLIRLRADIEKEFEEACAPYEVSVFIRPATTLASVKRSMRRGSTQHRRSSGAGIRRGSGMESLLQSGMDLREGSIQQAETSIVRVTLQGVDGVKDPRWLIASKKAPHPDVEAFGRHVRRWVLMGGIVRGLCGRSLGFPVSCVGLRQCCIAYGISDPVGAYRLVKAQRNGFLATSGIAFDSIGVFLGPEEDRLCSMRT